MYSNFQHPNNVCMSYSEHWLTSIYYARKLFVGSIKAIIHAFVPSFYKTSTQDLIIHIDYILKKKGCKENIILSKSEKFPAAPPPSPASSPTESPTTLLTCGITQHPLYQQYLNK